MKCESNRYYQILELKNLCTKEKSKKAYKKLSLLLHLNKNKYENAEKAFKRRQNSVMLLEATRDPCFSF